MTFAPYAKQIPDELISSIRTAMIVTSIIGIVLGIIAVVWPSATVVVLAVLFGIALIVAGLFRIYVAFAAKVLGTGWRILTGILGFLVLVMGIIALFSPANAVWFLALFIGFAWLFDGIGDLVTAFSKTAHAPTWYLILTGVISILAGLVLLIGSSMWALSVLVWVAGIFLIVISVITLFNLPKKVSDQSAV